jgi:hypothetical protein
MCGQAARNNQRICVGDLSAGNQEILIIQFSLLIFGASGPVATIRALKKATKTAPG